MTFQFSCPQGHALSADESQQGRRSQCPQCGTIFDIPFLGWQAAASAQPPHVIVPQATAPHIAVPQQISVPRYPLQQQPGTVPQLPTPPPSAASHPPLYAGAPPGTQSAWPAVPSAPPASVSSLPEFPFLAGTPESGGKNYDLNHLAGDVAAVPGPWEEESNQLDELKIHLIPCPKGHLLETPDDMLDQEVLCPFCNTQFRLRYADSMEARNQYEREIAARDARRGQLWLKWAIGIAVLVVLGMIGLIVAANLN